MSKETFVNLISDLGKMIGIPHLTVDDDEYCFLKIDEKILMTLFRDADTDFFTLHCELGSYEEDYQNEVLKSLLEANYLWSGTGGACLGINSQNKTILMAYKHPLFMTDFQQFFSIIQTFVNTAEVLMDEIVKIRKTATNNIDQPREIPLYMQGMKV